MAYDLVKMQPILLTNAILYHDYSTSAANLIAKSTTQDRDRKPLPLSAVLSLLASSIPRRGAFHATKRHFHTWSGT